LLFFLKILPNWEIGFLNYVRRTGSIKQKLTHAIGEAGGNEAVEEISRKARDIVTKDALTPADYKVRADAQELLGDFKGSVISRRLGEDMRRGRDTKTD